MSLIDFLAYLGTHVADLRKQVTELRGLKRIRAKAEAAAFEARS